MIKPARCVHLALSSLPLLLAATPALAQDARTDALVQKVKETDTIAWDIVEGLTTEVGQRLPGTEAEARARDWSVKKLKALGFQNVRSEPYRMPVWVRGEERGAITAPYPHKLAITALGNSGATPPQGLTGELVYFRDMASFEAAPDSAIRGKIAFIDHAMEATQDGSSYGYYGRVRRAGPALGAKKGALAVVIRSIGTDHHRNPHTGITSWPDGVTPIPAAAVSVPDAENIARIAKRGKPMQMSLTLTPRFIGEQDSGNVVAEIPGSDPKAGMVLVACHLDSWDLGTGAIDDGAGCGIMAAAAIHATHMTKKPRRTIRVLWAGSEEVGSFGGKAFAEAHKDEYVAVAGESDFGAGRIWKFETNFAEDSRAVADRLEKALAPLGIARGRSNRAGDGADIAATMALGRSSGIDMSQDGSDYFNLHHTPDDTLDKIDPAALRQNVAAWAAAINILANAPESLKPAPKP